MNDLNQKLGSLLKLERERQGLGLEELSEKLKNTVDGLQNIEAGNMEGFPSALYFTLFTKSYASVLGIDYERTIEAIKEEIGQSLEPSETKSGGKGSGGDGPTDSEGERASGDSQSNSGMLKKVGWAFLGLIGLLAVVLLVDNFVLNDDQFGLTGSQPSGLPEQIEGDKAAQATIDKYADFDWDVPAYEKPSTMTLKLTPRGESWATILADGDTAIFRKLIPGRSYEAVAQYRLRVSVGVPSAVDIELNGQPVALNISASGRISRVRINQMNLESFFKSRPTSPEPVLSPPTLDETTGDEATQTETTIGLLNEWRKVTMLGSTGPGQTDDREAVSGTIGLSTL